MKIENTDQVIPMWHFALDAKDASDLDGSKLATKGISPDFSYGEKAGEKAIEEFKREHPQWNDRASDEVDFLEELVFFKVDGPDPAEKFQAIEFVTDNCFWAPMLVTQDGQLVATIDYADDSQVRICTPD